MLKITIPHRTPSVNHLYGRRNGGGMYIKKEGVELRRLILDILINTVDVDLNPYRNKPLRVVVRITDSWLTKSGNIRRSDIANREKFLIDSVFAPLRIDDKCIWRHTMEKVHTDGDERKAEIEISIMEGI